MLYDIHKHTFYYQKKYSNIKHLRPCMQEPQGINRTRRSNPRDDERNSTGLIVRDDERGAFLSPDSLFHTGDQR